MRPDRDPHLTARLELHREAAIDEIHLMFDGLWGDSADPMRITGEEEVRAAESIEEIRAILGSWLMHLLDPPPDPDIEAVRVVAPIFSDWTIAGPGGGPRDQFDWPCAAGLAEERSGVELSSRVVDGVIKRPSSP